MGGWVFVVVVVQVLEVVIQGPQVGPGQVEMRVCVIVPVCPVGQERVCVCGFSGVQEVVVCAPQAFAIAALVMGPTTPQPFVASDPEQRFILSHWKRRTLSLVFLPK